MSTKLSIDWFTCTLRTEEMYEAPSAGYMYARVLEVVERLDCEELRGLSWRNTGYERGYIVSFSTPQGVSICIPHDAATGYKITLSGRFLRKCDDQFDVINTLFAAGVRCSRIDVALDMLDENVEIPAVWAGMASTGRNQRRRKVQYIQSDRSGETLYVGSRTSDFYVRLYNKAAEQALWNMDWKRLEIEIKHDAAHAVDYVDESFCVAAIRKAFSMINSDDEAFASVEDGLGSDEEEYAPALPRAKANSEVWLHRQVIPALLKLRRDNSEAYHEFLFELNRRARQQDEVE